MEITKKAKEELEDKIKKLENLIEERGLGSSYLNKVRKIQRDINLAIFLGGIITLAGITIWLLSGDDKEK